MSGHCDIQINRADQLVRIVFTCEDGSESAYTLTFEEAGELVFGLRKAMKRLVTEEVAPTP